MEILKNVKNTVKNYLDDESGQTSTEYILLLAVVAAVIYKFKGAFSAKMESIIKEVFESNKFDDILK